MLPRNSSPRAARSCCPGRVLLIIAALWLLAGCQVLIGISDIDGLQDPESDGDGGVPSTDAPAPNPGTRRIQLTFRNSARAETLFNVPVLVTLNGDRISYEHTAEGGADVRFVDDEGQVLAHEIERWDPAGDSLIWVKVPFLEGGTDSDVIYLYYGDESAGVEQQPTQVWSDAFAGVYHLGDDLTGGAQLRDSTGNGNYGMREGSVQGKAAKVGSGLSFPGTLDSYVNLYDVNAYEPDIDKPLTAEAWFYATPTEDIAAPTLLYKDYDCQGWMVYLGGDLLATYFSAAASGCASQQLAQSLVFGVQRNRWYYMTATMQRMPSGALQSCTTLYDGESEAPVPQVQCIEAEAADLFTVNDGFAFIGRGTSPESAFAGILDEVRISSTVRSADWMSLQYASMSDALIVYGPDEEMP